MRFILKKLTTTTEKFLGRIAVVTFSLLPSFTMLCVTGHFFNANLFTEMSTLKRGEGDS